MTPCVIVPVIEGYRLWSAGYDEGPNPLLALEMRRALAATRDRFKACAYSMREAAQGGG